MANCCEASRNSPSNTRTEPETARQKRGFSGSTQAMRPGLSRAFEKLQTASRSPDGRIHRPIYSSSCTTGCATIGRESGFLYSIMWMMLASSSRLQGTGQDGQTNGIGSGNLRPLVAYLPQCPNGSILITTRSKNAALKLVEQRDIIAIEPMSKPDALALLRGS